MMRGRFAMMPIATMAPRAQPQSPYARLGRGRPTPSEWPEVGPYRLRNTTCAGPNRRGDGTRPTVLCGWLFFLRHTGGAGHRWRLCFVSCPSLGKFPFICMRIRG